MSRICNHRSFASVPGLARVGLTPVALGAAVDYLYTTLDRIDQTLVSMNEDRLARLVELANFSSMVGNLLRSGVSKHSNGAFRNNGPHKFPDLLSTTSADQNVEIKVALEDNNPKGHLAKEGWHLTAHYVLCGPDGCFSAGKENRGVQLWIWQLRFGYLGLEHFNISNTEGDSGKTAVVNATGMRQLQPVFCDFDRCPFSPRGPRFKELCRISDERLHRRKERFRDNAAKQRWNGIANLLNDLCSASHELKSIRKTLHASTLARG